MDQNYTLSLLNVFISGLIGVWGILAITALLAALLGPRFAAALAGRPRQILFALAVALGVGSFYSGVYEYPEDPESLLSMVDSDRDCGTVWTGWIQSGYGVATPCEKGCYSTLTLRKQLRMRGFPPEPESRRKLQCRRYDEGEFR